jgi:DNA-damage-inducible protein J
MTENAAVLAAMGLTVSGAFRLMMMRIAADKALPFEPLVPNAKTIEAMKAARRGRSRGCARPRSC